MKNEKQHGDEIDVKVDDNGPKCYICEFVVKELENFILANSTKVKICYCFDLRVAFLFSLANTFNVITIVILPMLFSEL